MQEMNYTDIEKMWGAFHGLWSDQVGTPNYDKKKWLSLESLILQALNRRLPREVQTAQSKLDQLPAV